MADDADHSKVQFTTCFWRWLCTYLIKFFEHIKGDSIFYNSRSRMEQWLLCWFHINDRNFVSFFGLLDGCFRFYLYLYCIKFLDAINCRKGEWNTFNSQDFFFWFWVWDPLSFQLLRIRSKEYSRLVFLGDDQLLENILPWLGRKCTKFCCWDLFNNFSKENRFQYNF